MTIAWKPFVAAVFVAPLLAGCGFAGMLDLPLPGSPAVGEDPIEVTAEFDDVLSLARDSTVKYDGVTVGRVEGIGRDGWTALATLKLRGDLDLPADATARIAQTSLLGEKYVQLAPPAGGGSGQLADGARIGKANTSRGREVEEVLGALSLLLNGGGLAQLHTISSELDTAFGNDEATKTFLRELNTFVSTLDSNRTIIIDTLENVDRLTGQLARDRKTIRTALSDITPAVDSLADQRDEIIRMLKHLDRFSVTASGVIRKTREDLIADLKAVQPILEQLAAAGDDLPRAIETILSFPFPDEVLQAVRGDYVNLDVLMDLSPLILAGNFGSAPTAPAGAVAPASEAAGPGATRPGATLPVPLPSLPTSVPPGEKLAPLSDVLDNVLGLGAKGVAR